jgi:hypothetical protein
LCPEHVLRDPALQSSPVGTDLRGRPPDGRQHNPVWSSQ